MKKAQGLKTLGDYRRVARDSLFTIYLPPECNSTSPYDAIKTALAHSKWLISELRSNLPVENWWSGYILPGTEYEMRNSPLFDCIKLMEFAKTYHEVKSIYDLFPDWPKRPDVNIRVFTSAGLSYLEAAFDFVYGLGRAIINPLQDAYLKFKKGKNIGYFDTCKFLNETPRIDDLKINPETDIIIEEWFSDIVRSIQKTFSTSEFSRHGVEAEFNSIEMQLEYEWNLWKKPQGTEGQGEIPSDLIDLAKAVGLYHRSRAQIKRDIQDGKIKDYRKIEKGKHWISRSEADSLYISK